MAIENFLLVLISAFVLLHFYIVPKALRSIPTATGPDILKRAAAFAMVSALRSVVLLLSGVTVALLSVTWIVAELGGRANAALFARAMNGLRWLQETIGKLEPGLALVIGALLIFVLIRTVRKGARIRALAQLDSDQKVQVDQIIAKANAGNLESLPPNEIMVALSKEFDHLAERLAALTGESENEAESEMVDRQRDILRAKIEELQGEYIRQDVVRRIHLKTDDAAPDSEHRTFFERVADFVSSKGSLTALDGTARFVKTVSMILIVPALLAVNSKGVGQAVENRVARLSELKLAARADEATKDWEQAVAKLPQQPESSPVGDSTLDAIARSFEDVAFAALLTGRHIGPSANASFTRRDIIAAGNLHSEKPSTATVVAQNATDDVAAIEKALSSPSKGPRTPLGRRYRDMLRTDADRNPAFSAKLQSLRQSFSTPSNSDDVARSLLKQTLGFATDGVKPSGELSAAVYDAVMGVVDPQELRSAANALMAEHKLQLSQLDDLDAVSDWLMRAETGPQWSPRLANRLNRVLAERMPTAIFEFELRPPTVSPNAARPVSASAVNVMRDFVTSSGARTARQSEAMTDAIAEFDDHFPASAQAEAATVRGQLLRSLHPAEYPAFDKSLVALDPADGAIIDAAASPPAGGAGGSGGGGGGGGGGADRGQRSGSARARPRAATARLSLRSGATSSSLSSVSRARSFARIRGFSRIGGVVFGRDPDSVSALDIRDVQFRKTGKIVDITLRDKHSKVQTLGPFSASILHRALVYAADGRLVAVTMVTAKPLAELKILAHPALVDTPIGCELIELDRFVDIYTGRTKERSEAEGIVEATHALYQLAWSERMVQTMTPTLINGLSDNERKFISQQVESAQRFLDGAETSTEIRIGLRLDRGLLDRKHTPVFAKPKYYDPTISGTVLRCSEQRTDVATFRRCLRSEPYARSDESVGRLLASLPTFQVWSGVRDQPFKLEESLSSLKRNVRSQSPIHFMLQIAFTSSPIDSDDDSEEPFEFPALENWLNQTVHTAVNRATNPFHKRVLRDAEEFVYAQRFVRAALEGDLGARFPLGRLTELTAATAVDANTSVSTPRWNKQDGKLQLLLARELQWISGMLANDRSSAALRKCALSLVTTEMLRTDILEQSSCPALFAGDLATSSGAEAREALAYAQSRFKEAQQALSVRRSLGVSNSPRGGLCPPS